MLLRPFCVRFYETSSADAGSAAASRGSSFFSAFLSQLMAAWMTASSTAMMGTPRIMPGMPITEPKNITENMTTSG